MKFSLQLLYERLDLTDCQTLLFDYHKGTYDNVMLYSESMTLSTEVLYVYPGSPTKLPELPEGAGLVCVLDETRHIHHNTLGASLQNDTLLVFTHLSFVEIFNRLASMLANLRTTIGEFQQIAYTKYDMQRLIELFYELFGNAAYLADPSFRVLAIEYRKGMRNISQTWREMENQGYLPFHFVRDLIRTGELRDWEMVDKAHCVNSKVFKTRFINYTLQSGGQVYGYLFLVEKMRNFRSSDEELVTLLGPYVFHAMMHNAHYQNIRGDSYESFMQDLFQGKQMRQELVTERMSFSNFPAEADYAVVVVQIPGGSKGYNQILENQLERCFRTKPVLLGGLYVLLYRHLEHSKLPELKACIQNITGSMECQIGVSDNFHGYWNLDTYYGQAKWALQAKGTVGWYHCCYMDHIFQNFGEKSNLKLLILPEIMLLKEYDETTNLDLLKTLYAYLRRERGILETSEYLHIHRNTLAYRIRKIQELYQLNLDDIITRQRILLSLEAVFYMDT